MLLIDVGNTRLKWRVQEQGAVTASGALLVSQVDLDELCKALPNQSSAMAFASVGPQKVSDALNAWAQKFDVPTQKIETQDQWQDLRNGYDNVANLGVDRWLAMVAARAITKDKVCIVDCGSAITLDYILADGCHQGGYIIPGARLMSNALNADTANIKVMHADIGLASVGKDTREAVLSGCSQMAHHGLKGLIDQAQQQGYSILLCGGDGESLAKALGHTYIEGLVLDGLALMVEANKH